MKSTPPVLRDLESSGTTTLPPIDIDKKVQADHCGDDLCDGGVDPGSPPDQLYPGQITVPLGCQCRTCGGYCQCRRCACSTPRQNNRPQAASRETSEVRRGRCCGSGGSGGSDVAKVPQPVEVRDGRKWGTGGLRDNKVELVSTPNDDVEWDEELPECCK